VAKGFRESSQGGVGVSQVGGIFVHKRVVWNCGEKCTDLLRDVAMQKALSAEQEAQAQELARELAGLVGDELLAMTRTLAATDDASLFGDTEFVLRDLALKIATKALQQHLDQKKTSATRTPG
jgi:hypothetical protein